MVASVEAPFAILEEPVKALLFDAIEPTQMMLGLIQEASKAINMIFPLGEELGVVDSHLVKVAHIQSVVRLYESV